MRPWIVTVTVPSTVFDVYDLTEVIDVLSEFALMLDGGTTDDVTGRRRPWSVTVEIPAPTAGRAALAGVRVVEVAFGRRALGFDVVTPAEHDVRTARAVDELRLRPTAAGLWSGPCVP